MKQCVVALAFILGSGIVPAEAQSAARTSDSPSDLLAATRSFFEQYERALRAGERSSLPGFYSRQGAYLVFNGQTRLRSWAAIDTAYRAARPPVFFAWDSLQFEVVPPSSVLAFGRFRLLTAGAADTTVFTYAALLVRTDSGMAIRVEHETALPSRRR